MNQLSNPFNPIVQGHSDTVVLNVFDQLKSGTSRQHVRLERAVDIMDEVLTRARYANLISDFQAFYAPLEQQIFSRQEWHGIEFDLESRRKLPMLDCDLKVLDLQTPMPCPNPPKLESFAEVLGAVYVLEGATLGGQVIGRHLQKQLGLSSDSGAAFFSSYAESVGPMWLAFRQFLVAQVTSTQFESEVVAGALETFEAFAVWLERDRLA
jgi:heme oxygenase (biliverdin-IX-beta and delta-forming)